MLDQRLSMWTTLVGPITVALAAVLHDAAVIPLYIAWVMATRYLFCVIVSGFRGGWFPITHPPILYFSQIVGAAVKTYVFFRLDRQPCTCEVMLSDGIYKGATVLPADPILTIFDTTINVRVQTQMSIKGLTKAVNGERVFLDMSDRRAIAVTVVQTSATSEAALRGDLYMPVVLFPEDGALGAEDIGKPARVRLSKQLFAGLI